MIADPTLLQRRATLWLPLSSKGDVAAKRDGDPAIEKVVDDIIAANPDNVEQARAKPTLIGWFVGQVMKSSGGKANPQAVNDLLKKKLGI